MQRFRLLTEEDRRRARLLQRVIISLVVFSMLMLPMLSYVTGLVWRYVVIGVFILGPLLPVSLLVRKGQVTIASWILVLNLLLLAVAISLTSGGVKSPGFAAFFIIIFFAGLLLGGRVAALIAFLATLSGLFMWLIERWGMLPEPVYRHGDFVFLIFASILFFLTYFVHDFSDRFMRRTVDRLRSEVSVRRLAEERYRSVIAALDEGIVVQDRQGIITAHNRRAEEILGMTDDEMMGRKSVDPVWRAIREDGSPFPGDEHPAMVTLRTGAPLHNVIMGVHHRDGSQRWISINSQPLFKGEEELPHSVVTSFTDITERRAVDAMIRRQAFYDSLTELPNRTLFLDRLNQAIAHCRRSGTVLAVLFLDLDRFKNINDTLGHGVGDGLLSAVADRLREILRSDDTVSRSGGDEFLVLLSDLSQATDAGFVADKILTAMAMPFRVGDYELHLTTSIGISVYPDHGEDAESLIKNADIALYRAKEMGRNTKASFSMAMDRHESMHTENELRRSLKEEHFELHFQPRVELLTGRITGFEALLRWNHPEKGMIGPDRFIPIAEESGLILPLGEWVLREAERVARKWRGLGLDMDNFTISVNVSGRQFFQPGFVHKLLSIVSENRSCIELEITETIAMKTGEQTLDILRQLDRAGFSLALDDFGTGYSSLRYLQEYPIDTLKIDRSFVEKLEQDERNRHIVETIIGLGHHLGLRTVAEGVQTPEQRERLASMGCDEIQGFLFSPAVPEAAALAMMQSGLQAD